MSSSYVACRGYLAALAVVSAAALLFVGFNPGSANAADVTSGNAVFKITSGKAGKVSAIRPAKVAKRFGKGAKVTAKLKQGGFNNVVRSGVAGGIKLTSGKRKVKVTGLKVSIYKKRAVIQGKLRGKKINVFKATGKARLDKQGRTARLNGAKLALTGKAAKQIRKALKLKKAPKGNLGAFSINLKVTSKAPVDPGFNDYSKECSVPIASRKDDSWPPASPLPALHGAVATTGPQRLDWGFKSSFRGYIFGFTGANALQALDGASRSDLPSPMDPTRGFSFPVSQGQFAANDPADPADDQALIEANGTGLFCNSRHFFWAAISDPTVVIDGANSRIVATVSQNVNGNGMFGEDGPWQTPVRIDLAELDLSQATRSFNKSGSVTTWDRIPAKLTSDAAPFATYPAGTELDPISVSISTGSTTPFPQETYCSISQTATVADWPASIPTPALFDDGDTASSNTSSGGLEWGVRQGMRGMNPFNPIVVSASPDVTQSDPSDMTGAGKYFGWSSDGGSYYADGRLVLPLKGTVGLCSQAHGYGTVLANPKVVIDGANSRIVVDVAARVGTDWLRGTVDFVEFDASSVTPTTTPVTGGTEHTWTIPDGDVRLTEGGAAVLGPIGAGGPTNPYSPGAAFQGFTVKATVPTE